MIRAVTLHLLKSLALAALMFATCAVVVVLAAVMGEIR